MTDFFKGVEYLRIEGGRSPFKEWFSGLDIRWQQIVDASIHKVRRGLRKQIKSLRDGVFEIKIDFGAGIRIYFAEESGNLILLIGGGTKRTQAADIKEAKELWNAYKDLKKRI